MSAGVYGRQGLAMAFRERFSFERKRRGLSQRDVADVLCVSKASVSRFECGRRQISAVELVVLACFFGMTFSQVLPEGRLQL